MSAWSQFPTTQNPDNLYKYASFEINLNKDLLQTNRQTYSLLDLLGDCGGLMDILIFIGAIFVNPISIYAARSVIATLLVSLLPSNAKDKKKKSSREN